MSPAIDLHKLNLEKIQVLNKITGIYKQIRRTADAMFKHPFDKQIRYLDDFKIEGLLVTGLIFKKDGTTLICYQNRSGGDKDGNE